MKHGSLPKLDANTRVMLKQIGWGVVAIASVSLILTAIWYGTRLPSLSVSNIEVFGGQTIDHARVTELSLQQLQGEYVGFIPRRFAWMYPEEDIVHSLSQLDRIHSIDINRTNGTTLYVAFEEYLPESLWCKTLLALECVFMDESGYAYAVAPNLAGGSLTRFIHTSKPPKIGSQLTLEEDFVLLQQLTDLLAENGWFISHVEVDKVRDAFLHIVDGGEFKVTLAQAPEVTVNNLQVVLTSEEFQDIQPGNFQYIDLRFGNKVFINEEPVGTDVVASSTVSEIDAEDQETGGGEVVEEEVVE